MRYASLFLLTLIVFSCQERRTSAGASDKEVVRSVDTFKLNRDSSINALLASFYEPSIQNSNHEIFRLIKIFPFPHQPTLIFRIENLGEKKFSLTTKVVSISDEDTGLVSYRGKVVAFNKSIILDSFESDVSLSEWQDFRMAIEGSYYRAFEDPCPDGDGILDGTTLIMESVSTCCNDYSLKYHFNHVHVPQGGFSEALNVLEKKAGLKSNE